MSNKARRQRLRVPLDFTNYTVLTKLLKNDAPYQIRYAIVDGETGQTDCVFMQIRLLPHCNVVGTI
ncbi:unnamed protein product [Gongylonema pulchrum]|uniref:Fibronectin type-III domain-containing protein n=1 Tax=Gongylonema pulchrum TaxID=637853 RepID=A0A183DDW9_9BILA|nr:unnamed protein product [Gongylonema pulchrum]